MGRLPMEGQTVTFHLMELLLETNSTGSLDLNHGQWSLSHHCSTAQCLSTSIYSIFDYNNLKLPTPHCLIWLHLSRPHWKESTHLLKGKPEMGELGVTLTLKMQKDTGTETQMKEGNLIFCDSCRWQVTGNLTLPMNTQLCHNRADGTGI